MINYFQSKQLRVSLIPSLSLVEGSEQGLALVSEYGKFEIRGAGPGMAAAFRALATGSHTEEALAKLVLDGDGLGGLTRFNHYYAQCVLRCFVQYSTYDDDLRLLTMQLTVPLHQFQISELALDQKYVISRFVYSRREDDQLILETPSFGAKLILEDWRASALLGILTVPLTLPEIAEKAPFVSSEALARMMALLNTSHALSRINEEGKAEDREGVYDQWEFHDLLFHSRSRIGRHNNRIGATFRHLGTSQPLPLIKPLNGDIIPLYQPEPSQMQARMSLAEAVESRKSIRTHGTEPISLKQLGEFLFRVARIRALWDFEFKSPDGKLFETLQLSNRPYPGGGAIYELEIYLTIDRCKDLAPGMYRYNPLEHALNIISTDDERRGTLLRDACMSAGINEKPQVLINLAARFQRMTWKYATIAYAATLKNVGVLYQTMYLVATDMGLAPCALGSGNSDLFANTAGTNYYAESSVGEFMLGTMPDNDESIPWAMNRQFTPNPFINSGTK